MIRIKAPCLRVSFEFKHTGKNMESFNRSSILNMSAHIINCEDCIKLSTTRAFSIETAGGNRP